MAVPNIFANVTTSIPLSQLDTNFATAITLGNTAVYLGNTTTTLANVTIANANVTTALLLTGAAGTSGQALTSAGANAAPTWTTIGASAATATSLGTVYGFGDTGTYGQAFIGYQTGNGNTTSAGNNTAMGQAALYTNSAGSWNSAFGFKSLFFNTSSYNTAYGGTSLYTNSTGSNNTAIGYRALFANTTGSSNTALGYNALAALQTTNSNVGLGNNAGTATTTGYENVFVGAGAGSLNTTGYFNICIGRSAGENTGPTTGASNTLIGNDARVTSASANTQLVVAARQTAVAKGDNTGFIDGGTGGIYQGNNSSSWSTTSDFRLKKNIVDNTEGLDKISQIRVRNFEYRTEEEVTELPAHTVIKKEGVQLGVIAQELREVCPDCVKEESTGVISVDSDNIFWHMVNAIKDLKVLIDAQATEIAELKAKVGA